MYAVCSIVQGPGSLLVPKEDRVSNSPSCLSLLPPTTHVIDFWVQGHLRHSTAVDESYPFKPHVLLPSSPTSLSASLPAGPTTNLLSPELTVHAHMAWVRAPLGPHVQTCVSSSRGTQYILTPFACTVSLPWGGLV